MTENCRGCRFYFLPSFIPAVIRTGQVEVAWEEQGVCRRHAPDPVSGITASYHGWPLVKPEDLCGEFEAALKVKIKQQPVEYFEGR